MLTKQIIINMLLAALWTAIGTGTIVLLLAAIQRKDANTCTGVEINIKGVSNNFFVDKNDILNTIHSISGVGTLGRSIGTFDLAAIETALEKNTWIKNTQLYFDNNELLQVNVLEREPVARIFTTGGTTFYLDCAVTILPMSDKFSARLPVFTNFPSDKRVLAKADSNLLQDILVISMAIQEDPFYMAMIEQVDITPKRTFEMVPKFGNTIIVFGNAKNAAEKLAKLRLFYKEVMVKAGWNKYSEINLQYKSQIVAKRKGAEDVKADYLRTIQLMQAIAENAEKMAGDSLHTIIQDNERNTTSKSIIQRSMERDDNSSSSNTTEEPKPQESSLDERQEIKNPPQDIMSRPAVGSENKQAPAIKKNPEAKLSGRNVKPMNKPKPTDTRKPKLVMPKPLTDKPVIARPDNEY